MSRYGYIWHLASQPASDHCSNRHLSHLTAVESHQCTSLLARPVSKQNQKVLACRMNYRTCTMSFLHLLRPSVKRFSLCYRTVVCLSCLSVCSIGVLLPKGWMDQDETWMEVSLGPGHFVSDWGPSSLSPKGAQHPQFSAMYVVAQRLDGLRWHLVWRQASAQATLC